MTKSPASQLIEAVVQGTSPRRAITEDKLAAIAPQLDKVRKQAIKQLQAATELVDQIGREVTVRDLANRANRAASDLTKIVDQLVGL